MYDFGLTLKELRKKHNMTQKKLADKLNITEGSISKYESNTASPPFDTLLSIAAIFNISMDELCGTQNKGAVSLYGLTENPIQLVCELVEILKERNISVRKVTSMEQYAIIGQIATELTK